MNRNEACALVDAELDRAIKKFPPMASAHDGYAIILEELDELWECVKMKNVPGNQPREDGMRKEAIQVAAMAIRFLVDVGIGPLKD